MLFRSISRASLDWGIRVPIDERHVIYVWLDALSNYITALGFPGEDEEQYKKYWPGINLVGKEIVRFHSIIWPAMLMSTHAFHIKLAAQLILAVTQKFVIAGKNTVELLVRERLFAVIS